MQNEEVFNLINKLKNNNPFQGFKQISNFDNGMSFVLLYLCDESKDIYASTISEEMGISRARVGVLLNKMLSKGYIKKVTNKNDARIDVIKITNLGKEKCEQINNEIVKNISKLINKFGYEKLNNFVDMACRIKEVLKEGDC